jgi:putative membrane protein
MTIASTLAQASDVAISAVPRGGLMVEHIVGAIVYSALGILVLLLTLFAMVRFAPFSVHKEIEEDHNLALAVVIASVLLGISIIIAAAILG